MLYQIIYRRCKNGININGQLDTSGDGYKIYSLSQELINDPNIDLKFLSEFIKKDINSVNTTTGKKEQLGDAYIYLVRKNDNHLFLKHQYISGKIASGGRGVFMTQSFIGDLGDYPCKFFASPLFGDKTKEDKDYYEDFDRNNLPFLSPIQKLEENLDFAPEKIGEFIKENPERIEKLKLAVWFLIKQFSLSDGDKKSLIIKADGEDIQRWIAAILYAFPPKIAQEISFSTRFNKNFKEFYNIIGIDPCDDENLRDIRTGQNVPYVWLNNVKTNEEDTLNDYFKVITEFNSKHQKFCQKFLQKSNSINNTKDLTINKLVNLYNKFIIFSEGGTELLEKKSKELISSLNGMSYEVLQDFETEREMKLWDSIKMSSLVKFTCYEKDNIFDIIALSKCLLEIEPSNEGYTKNIYEKVKTILLNLFKNESKWSVSISDLFLKVCEIKSDFKEKLSEEITKDENVKQYNFQKHYDTNNIDENLNIYKECLTNLITSKMISEQSESFGYIKKGLKRIYEFYCESKNERDELKEAAKNIITKFSRREINDKGIDLFRYIRTEEKNFDEFIFECTVNEDELIKSEANLKKLCNDLIVNNRPNSIEVIASQLIKKSSDEERQNIYDITRECFSKVKDSKGHEYTYGFNFLKMWIEKADFKGLNVIIQNINTKNGYGLNKSAQKELLNEIDSKLELKYGDYSENSIHLKIANEIQKNVYVIDGKIKCNKSALILIYEYFRRLDNKKDMQYDFEIHLKNLKRQNIINSSDFPNYFIQLMNLVDKLSKRICISINIHIKMIELLYNKESEENKPMYSYIEKFKDSQSIYSWKEGDGSNHEEKNDFIFLLILYLYISESNKNFFKEVIKAIKNILNENDKIKDRVIKRIKEEEDFKKFFNEGKKFGFQIEVKQKKSKDEQNNKDDEPKNKKSWFNSLFNNKQKK